MRLTINDVRELDALADPDGVLSVYHDATPAGAPAALGRSLGHSGAPEPVLRRLRPQLEAIATAGGPRGRMLFAPLSGGAPLMLQTAMPLRPAAVLEPTGHVLPLVEALDEGHQAGVVVCRTGSVEVHEWRQGTMEPVGEPLAGRSPAARAAVAARIAALGSVRDWRRLLLAGDPRIAGELAAIGLLDSRQLAVVATGDPDALAVELERCQRVWELRLVDRALRAGATKGIGPAVRALAGGRVARLVFDQRRAHPPDRGPGLRTDPLERLVELALERGGEIVPVHGRAGRALDAAGGVIATERW